MKILVTGVTGYVGRLIFDHFFAGEEVYGTSSTCHENGPYFRCDLRNEDEARLLCDKVQPDAVFHAAGQKDIPYCETHPRDAHATNCVATKNVALAFGERCRIFYISTDYVFDGTRGNYSEDDVPNPLTVYGKSKFSGEQEGLRIAKENFVVIRAAALYNVNSKFIRYLTNNLSSGKAVSCFTDTFYSPTYSVDLLNTMSILLHGSYDRRIYHVCGSRASRFEFASLVAKAYGYESGLVLPVRRPPENWFLLSDLSMNAAISQDILGNCVTSHERALGMLVAQREQV